MIFDINELKDQVFSQEDQLRTLFDHEARLQQFAFRIITLLETALRVEASRFLTESDTRTKAEFINETKGWNKAIKAISDLLPK